MEGQSGRTAQALKGPWLFFSNVFIYLAAWGLSCST